MKNCVSMNLVFLLVVSLNGHLLAEDSINDMPQLSPAEQELISLLDEYKEKKSAHWAEQKKSATFNEDGIMVLSKIDMPDPEIEYIPRIMAFEERHRGEEVGIDALRFIYNEAGRGGGFSSPAYLARRESLASINAYSKYYAVIGLLDRLGSGDHEPGLVAAAQSIIDSSEASRLTKAMASYYQAKRYLWLNKTRNLYEKRKQALLNGAESKIYGTYELDFINVVLDSVKDAESLVVKAEESLELLGTYASEEKSPRLLKKIPLDPKYRIVRYVEDDSRPRVPELVGAFLYKERNLQVGMPAPLLELDLLGGDLWKMEDQLGKYVVLQFSFTGCGPCARMYPGLKELVQEYPDDISIVTIMRDDTPDNALEGIESGKLTWNIVHDGKPGKLTAMWSVRSFPTTYVIDREGNILRTDMASHSFKKDFLKILADQDQASDS